MPIKKKVGNLDVDKKCIFFNGKQILHKDRLSSRLRKRHFIYRPFIFFVHRLTVILQAEESRSGIATPEPKEETWCDLVDDPLEALPPVLQDPWLRGHQPASHVQLLLWRC